MLFIPASTLSVTLCFTAVSIAALVAALLLYALKVAANCAFPASELKSTPWACRTAPTR